jgi:parallel beta-helix repeat protein
MVMNVRAIRLGIRAGIVVAVGVAALAVAGPALAANCGDTAGPGGTDVPCACGDTVVTDTVLTKDDPVVKANCPADALIIATSGLLLDLGGNTLTGSGNEAGVRVEAADSVEIVNGKISRFNRGIDATNPSMSGGFIEDVRVSDNKDDGIKIEGDDNALVDVHADKNGRHGVNLVGARNDVEDSRADKNAQDGIKVQGSNGTLTDNSAKKNGSKGIDAPGANDGGGNTCKKNGSVGSIGGTPC